LVAGRAVSSLRPPAKSLPARLSAAAPRVLFDTGIRTSVAETRNHYVVTRDGQRFLVNISADDENSAPITVVLNWDAPPTK
jgi:hypothetical protein